MIFNYNQNTYDIDTNLIEKYEKLVAPFTEVRFRYFFETSCNKNDSVSACVEKIEKSINEEISLYINKEDILAKAITEGILDVDY